MIFRNMKLPYLVFLRDKYVFYSDLYSIISFLEINIHSLVKRELKRKFKENWWREGIPESLRQKLASDHERDDTPPNYVTEDENKMCYTSFVNLFEIMKKIGQKFLVNLMCYHPYILQIDLN